MKDNEQHAFDKTVRQALENLEIPFVADHWIEMADKLAALDAEEAAFDNNLADKLRGIETPFIADHWLKMAGKLDVLDAEEADFDNNFAYKLKDIEVPYQPANWADMATRLEDLDDSETAFDDLLSQRLDNLHVKYQPMHWDFMAQQIEDTFSWRAKVMRYKLVEVALVLLTLFTVGNAIDLPFDSDYSNTGMSPLKVEKKKDNDVKKATKENIKQPESFNNSNDWRNRSASPIETKLEQNSPNKPVAAVNNRHINTVINSEIVQLNNGIENAPLKDALIDKTNNASEIVAPFDTKSAQTVAYTEGGGFDKLPMKKVKALGKVFDSQPIDNQSDTGVTSRILASVDILKPKLLDTRFYDENVTYPIYVEKRAKWRLNLFGLPIADMISYNYNKSRTKVTENQTVANLGAGVAFAYKKNKLEVETGVSYLDKKYYLPNVEFVSGNFRSNYKVEKPLSIRLSIVSIPLSTNYTFSETHRWRFYSHVGMALNTILKSKEELFIETSNSTASAPANPVNNYGQYEPNVYPKGILEKDFFKDGVWINGGFKKNSYVTANAGLGVEYRFTNKIDIYVQPTFDYHLSKRGIGTLDDRINSFSVQGGVKMKLK